MEESTQSVTPQDPAMTSLFQGLSEDNVRLAVMMAKLMEGKDKGDCEMIIKTLSGSEASNISDQSKPPTNSHKLPNEEIESTGDDLKQQYSDNAMKTDSESKDITNGDLPIGRTQEETNEEKQNLSDTNETMNQNEQMTNTTTLNRDDVPAKQQAALQASQPDENNAYLASSDDDMAPSTPASERQSSGSELSESPSEEKPQISQNTAAAVSSEFRDPEVLKTSLVDSVNPSEGKNLAQGSVTDSCSNGMDPVGLKTSLENSVKPTVNAALASESSNGFSKVRNTGALNTTLEDSIKPSEENSLSQENIVISTNVRNPEGEKTSPNDSANSSEGKTLTSGSTSSGFSNMKRPEVLKAFPKDNAHSSEEKALASDVMPNGFNNVNNFEDSKSSVVYVNPDTHQVNYNSPASLLKEQNAEDLRGTPTVSASGKSSLPITGLAGLKVAVGSQQREQYEGFQRGFQTGLPYKSGSGRSNLPRQTGLTGLPGLKSATQSKQTEQYEEFPSLPAELKQSTHPQLSSSPLVNESKKQRKKQPYSSPSGGKASTPVHWQAPNPSTSNTALHKASNQVKQDQKNHLVSSSTYMPSVSSFRDVGDTNANQTRNEIAYSAVSSTNNTALHKASNPVKRDQKKHSVSSSTSTPSVSGFRGVGDTNANQTRNEIPYSAVSSSGETPKSVRENQAPNEENLQPIASIAGASIPLLPQGMSTSIVCPSSALASLPLYYQPHIVMKDNIPVLMLKPVLLPSISGELSNQGIDFGASSMVFPLQNTQAANISAQVTEYVTATSDTENTPNTSDQQHTNAQHLSEYVDSTESDAEEKVANIPRRKQPEDDWLTWTSAITVPACDNGASLSQQKNPFLDDDDSSSTSSQPFMTSAGLPTSNFGYSVPSSVYQNAAAPSSNPFYQEEPLSNSNDGGLSRTDFNTIPKSMLASQVTPRGPPVSQIDNRAHLRGPQISQVLGSTTVPRGHPVSQASRNATVPRGPSVSQMSGGNTVPRGHPLSQASGNATVPRGPSVSQMSGSNTLPRGPPASQVSGHNISPMGPPINQMSSTMPPRGPSVNQGSTTAPWGLTVSNDYEVRGLPLDQQGLTTTQPLRGPPVSQQNCNTTLPMGTGASQAGNDSTQPGQRLSDGSMVTFLELTDDRNTANDIDNFQAPLSVEPSTLSASSNFTSANVLSSFGHDTNGAAADPTVSAVPNVGTTVAKPQAQPELKPKMPGHVAPYWTPDGEIFKCAYCHLKFTLVRRKHHCRGCGKIFCSNCCSQLARLSYLQYQIGRICIYCTNIIKEYKKQKKESRTRRSKTNPTQMSNPYPYPTTSLQPGRSLTVPTVTQQSPGLTGLTSQSVTNGQERSTTSNDMTQLLSQSFASAASSNPASAFHPPGTDRTQQITTDNPEFKLPLRPAGRIVSWKAESFSSRLMAQDRRKALAKDLKELIHGVKMQLSDDLQVIVKKAKGQSSPLVQAWCCHSVGFNVYNQQEIAMCFKINPKEDVIPEEILRMYKVILDLVKLGHIFVHSNFLAFKSPFLGTHDNAALIFASSSLVKPNNAFGQSRANFLYAILVKRPELDYAQYVPTRYLLRLGQEFKNFPFPIVNSRDRAPVYDGVDHDDIIYTTVVSLNKHLRNSVPEAIIPGLAVLQEDSKVVLQVTVESQATIIDFFDRLIVKTNQSAAIPLVSDLSTSQDQYRVYHQSIRTDQISLRKHMSLFRSPTNSGEVQTVTGLGFVLLLLGASGSPVMEQRGKLVDDGAVIHLTDVDSQKLRQCLRERSNFNFYLGDQSEILYFELRWFQDPTNHLKREEPGSQTVPQEAHPDSSTGSATIDVRHSGQSSELKKVAQARLGDSLIIVRLVEQQIKRGVTKALMMQANRMKAGETKEVMLKLSLRNGKKKWSIGPANQPMNLIRSLQMALFDIMLTDLGNACLDLTFDVTIIKQFDLIAQRFDKQ